MLTALILFLRSIALICGGSRAVALENLTLRQQLAALTRTAKRPRLRARDRLFWIVLAKVWQEWRTAVIFVQPDTVVRWHGEWLRRQWKADCKQTQIDPCWPWSSIHQEMVKVTSGSGRIRSAP
jgi:hypothetical protein